MLCPTWTICMAKLGKKTRTVDLNGITKVKAWLVKQKLSPNITETNYSPSNQPNFDHTHVVHLNGNIKEMSVKYLHIVVYKHSK